MKKSASYVTTVGALARREDDADARYILILVQHGPLCTSPFVFHRAYGQEKDVRNCIITCYTSSSHAACPIDDAELRWRFTCVLGFGFAFDRRRSL